MLVAAVSRATGGRPIAVIQSAQFFYALTGRKLKRRRKGSARFALRQSMIKPAIKTSQGRSDHGAQILLSALVETPLYQGNPFEIVS